MNSIRYFPAENKGNKKKLHTEVCSFCHRTESNCRHMDFQSIALPTELQRHEGNTIQNQKKSQGDRAKKIAGKPFLI